MLARAVQELAGSANGYELRCLADLRYVGQSFELMVPFTPGDAPAVLEKRFHAEHERRYGHAAYGKPVELVTLRASIVQPGPAVTIEQARGAAGAPFGERDIRAGGRTVKAALYREDALAPGLTLETPAVVEYEETTCLVPPGWGARVDKHGLLRLEAAR